MGFFLVLLQILLNNPPLIKSGVLLGMNESVKSLEFSLPMRLSVQEGSSEVESRIELPEVFFGLEAVKQVSILDGVSQKLSSTLSSVLKLSDEQSGPFSRTVTSVIGIFVNYYNKGHGEIEVNFTIPGELKEFSPEEGRTIHNALAFNFLSAITSIINREENHGG